MDMNSLQDRLQREAREIANTTIPTYKGSIFYYFRGEDLDQIISHTISETIKAGVSVVEGEKKTGMNGEGLPFENSPEIYGNARIEAYKSGHNQALQTAVTKLQELLPTNDRSV